MNINKCICTGRLTKDPELRSVSEEMQVCQLRLAVDGMGRGREVGFINVSVFGKAGEAAGGVEKPRRSSLGRAGWRQATARWRARRRAASRV